MKKTIISFIVLSLISANAYALSFTKPRVEGKPGVKQKVVVKNNTPNKVYVRVWTEKEETPMTLADIAGIKNPVEYANGIESLISPRMVYPEVLAQIGEHLTIEGKEDPYGIKDPKAYIKGIDSLAPSDKDSDEIKARKAVLNKISDEIEVKKAFLKTVYDKLPSCVDALTIRPMSFVLEPDEPTSVSVKSSKAGYCRLFFEDRKAPVKGDEGKAGATSDIALQQGISVRMSNKVK